jgi:hypothetical protein
LTILSLPDAKAHLNIVESTNDAELATMISAAESRIALDCGPLEPEAKTQRVRGGGESLSLRTTPAISLTSVTPVPGAALTLADLYLDTDTGLVTFNDGRWFTQSKYDVVYSAGRATVSDSLLMGIKELVRHAWSRSQRGGTRRPGSSPSDGYANTMPGAGDELPWDVQKWIAGHVQGPGVG